MTRDNIKWLTTRTRTLNRLIHLRQVNVGRVAATIDRFADLVFFQSLFEFFPEVQKHVQNQHGLSPFLARTLHAVIIKVFCFIRAQKKAGRLRGQSSGLFPRTLRFA